MLTRARIAAGLEAIARRIAADRDPPEGYPPEEWAYVGGLAEGAILRARDFVLREPASS